MIKKTLYFGNPTYLSQELGQLKVSYPADEKKPSRTVPIEDIGLVILDSPRVTITQSVLSQLMANNTAVLSCDEKHLPAGLFLPMTANHSYTEKLRFQLDASKPLKKNLWQQTIKAKIKNQAALLTMVGKPIDKMLYWSEQVKSGDPDNYEGRAAAYYWKELFDDPTDFRRGRFGESPNHLLNYGYAVLRAIVARSLVSSGMLPAHGIHHRNKYNPFCLADDIMEPYRPYVDFVVLDVLQNFNEDEIEELRIEVKQELLKIPRMDVVIDGNKSPLMVGMTRTTASLMQCFEGTRKKILYPVIDPNK